jgi:D-alanyl-lipoteichoic acid acyltransferase DltB (MBOAT superfamily)
MLFTSWTFLVFFGIVLLLYYRLPMRGQNTLLLIASYVFYGAWDWRFLLLLFFSTCVDYFVGLGLERYTNPRTRKLLIVATCCSNLGILSFFKYFNFFVDSASRLMAAFGLASGAWRPLHIILPVGISFYTFQSLSYTIDCYRGRMKPVHHFPDFALFVAYFPQLVAGPIERAVTLAPQLMRPRQVNRTHVVEGCWLILWGFFKKMVIADTLAGYVNNTFAASSPQGGWLCLLSIYAFAFQIYGDFSGYSDIARGVSKLLGIELMLNFNLPYLARNPAEFWHRWHISLSTWLRDYLYIPLGGNRHGRWRTYRNLLLTMLLGGLWHGAAWNFILWGAYHGVLLAIHRFVFLDRPAPARPRSRSSLAGILSAIAMFHLTCLGWLFFRARSLAQIQHFLGQILFNWQMNEAASRLLFALLVFVFLLAFLEWLFRNADDLRTRPVWRMGLGPAVAAGVLVGLILLTTSSGREFIYFQF